MNLTNYFVKGKLHLTRTWSILTMPVQIGTFLFSAYTVASISGEWWVLWLFPLGAVVSVFIFAWDRRELFSRESAYSSVKNPVFMEMRADIKEIKRCLN